MSDIFQGRPIDHNSCSRPSDFYAPETEQDTDPGEAEARWKEAGLVDSLSDWAEAYEQRQSESSEAIDSNIPFPELLEVAQRVMAAQPPAAPPRSQPDAA